MCSLIKKQILNVNLQKVLYISNKTNKNCLCEGLAWVGFNLRESVFVYIPWGSFCLFKQDHRFDMSIKHNSSGVFRLEHI